MITDLPDEVLYYMFINFLNFFDTVEIKNTSYRFKLILSDDFYKHFAFKLYGKEFWELANMRDPRVSMPRKTFLEELRRLEAFQSNYVKIHKIRCSNKEFYNFWVTVEPELEKSYNMIIGK